MYCTLLCDQLQYNYDDVEEDVGLTTSTTSFYSAYFCITFCFCLIP